MQQKNLIIYKSSAGSGKTFTLVKEYLLLALRYPTSFEKILAITFTNKATEEMKGRIIEALVTFSSGRSIELSKLVCDDLNIDAEELQKRSKE